MEYASHCPLPDDSHKFRIIEEENNFIDLLNTLYL